MYDSTPGALFSAATSEAAGGPATPRGWLRASGSGFKGADHAGLLFLIAFHRAHAHVSRMQTYTCTDPHTLPHQMLWPHEMSQLHGSPQPRILPGTHEVLQPSNVRKISFRTHGDQALGVEQ